MLYKKINTEFSIIEFHTNWLGVESIVVNGQIVSKKRASLGTSHYFTVFEQGHVVPYILTTKWDLSGSYGKYKLDLRRDGEIIKQNIHVKYNTKSKKDENEFKTIGLKHLNEYEIPEAIIALEKALNFSSKDPEIYFHLACCYSIKEKTEEGFECMKKAVELSLIHI